MMNTMYEDNITSRVDPGRVNHGQKLNQVWIPLKSHYDEDYGKDDNGKDDNGKDDNGKDGNGKDGNGKDGDVKVTWAPPAPLWTM